MRKIVFCLAVMLVFSFSFAYADSYHQFGANPVAPNGLSSPASGAVFLPTPYDIPAVRMWGASGESSVKTLPAGTLVEVYQRGNMYVASRVVCCGNPIQGVVWAAPQQNQAQAQAQAINVNVNLTFQQPAQKPDRTLYMNPKMTGPTIAETYRNVGNGEIKTVTWSSTNIGIANNNGNFDNSSQGGAGGTGVGYGGAGGNANQTQIQGQNQGQSQTGSTNNIENYNINQNQNINNNANAND